MSKRLFPFPLTKNKKMNDKKIVFTILVAATLAMIAFGQPGTGYPKSSLAQKIVGEWRNQSIKIKINSYRNKDTIVLMEANASNWEEKLHIKPIRTFFKADRSYYSEYRDLQDSIIRRPTGEWRTRGDTIVMTELTPEKAVYTFHLSIKKNIATFIGVIDFDGDGKKDDEYYGTQKKF